MVFRSVSVVKMERTATCSFVVNIGFMGFVTRAVFWAWNSSSIPLINYFGLEGLVGPFNLWRKAGLQGLLMPKGNGTYLVRTGPCHLRLQGI